jgi:hypothetical protein
VTADESLFEHYAVYLLPLTTQLDDGRWRAQYPDTDWFVTADSAEDAGSLIAEEAIRRRHFGEPDYQPSEDLLQRHLQNPIPGVYALDTELFVYLRTAGKRAELDAAFEEAERRRRLGQAYTKADYLRARQEPGYS